MLELNLPPIDCKIKEKKGKLFIKDVVRNKFIVLTPEEWVRQHFIHYLISHKKVPSTRISLELSRKYNQLNKRCDIVVWSKDLVPVILVECKASHIDIANFGMSQLTSYNSTLNVDFLCLTNGISHKYFQKSGTGYKAIDELPGEI